MKTKIAFLCVLMAMLSLPAQAAIYRFEAISIETPANAAIGEAQAWVDVAEYAMGQVSFTFHNDGPVVTYITDAYFDDGTDGTLLSIASISGSPGVDFYQLTQALPDGNEIIPAFVTTDDFSVDTVEISDNGVNPGEWLTIVFDLQDERVFSEVLDDLSSGELRIGILMTRFPEGSTRESFINDPSPVPIPSSLFLLGSGLVGFLACSRIRLTRRA